MSGAIALQAPHGDDWIPRRFAEIERMQREGLAAIAQSFQTTVAELRAAQEQLTDQVGQISDLIDKQVSPGSTSAYEGNFTVATTDEDRAITTIAVPAGYTRAVVMMVANVGVINPRTSVDYIYCSAVINGSASREMFALAGPNGGSASIATSKAAVLAGLTGGSSVTVAARLHAQGGAWSANASNRVYVEAQAVFLR